ncbi:MAG: nucleotidyl transferase AbiEii/AbiGii toxin family protein [Candidatus Pacebacteria bacterium]|nr:nucleotidyl transferase AbiEii/AbiGii toxin family protein [Candidatus Paceibacterota bacterium]
MTLDAFKHKNLLIQILKDIYTNKFLINKLGFKGGTAAYLFYNLNRDSVDLDFDLIDTEDEFRVLNEIKGILLKYGKIVDSFNKKNTLINIVSYSKEDRNIKVEINKNNYGARYEGKNFMGLLIKVMRREDMIAFKLLAMNDRLGKANRDIFDVCFFLSNN